MEYICKYCGRIFKNAGALKTHENVCSKNPDRTKNLSKRKPRTKETKEYICKYCGRVFNNSGACKSHENRCEKNPNRTTKKKSYTKPNWSDEELTCQYCGRKFKMKGNLRQHEVSCEKNPNRIARTVLQKYDMMTDAELLKEVKKYPSRAETPGQLIKICKRRRIYSWTGNYGPEHNWSDKKLINELDKYERKIDIPGTLARELKRRGIELPQKFNVNPRRKNNITYISYTDSELLKMIENISNIYEAKDLGLIEVVDELKRRNVTLPAGFYWKLTFSPYHYKSDEELMNILNKFNSKFELFNAGYGKVFIEAEKRKLFIPKQYIEIKYENMSSEDLLNMLKPYSKLNDIIHNGLRKVYDILCERGVNLNFINKKEFHPEYFKMTNDEILQEAKIWFKDCNRVRFANGINRALVNQLRARKLLNIVFPEKDRSFYGPDYGIKLGKEKYGDTYDYSKVHETYVNWKTPVKIGCPVHGFVEMSFPAHLNYENAGCPHCSREIQVKNAGGISTSEKKRFIKIHNNDILHLSIPSILYLVKLGALGKEYSKKIKLAPNTLSRQQEIDDISNAYDLNIDDYVDNVDDNIDDIKTDCIIDNTEDIINDIKAVRNILKDKNIDINMNNPIISDLIKLEVESLFEQMFKDENNETYNKIKDELSIDSSDLFGMIYNECIKQYDELEYFEAS